MNAPLTRRQQPIPEDVLEQIRQIQAQQLVDEKRRQLYHWLEDMIEQGHRV